MALTLNLTEKNFCREFGHSLANAENSFISTLAEIASISADDAGKVLDTYRKHKLVKFDRTNSRFVVKHGGFLDVDVIRRALAS